MRYQKIESRIWNDEKFTQLTPLQQRLFLYILTCPHGNLIGLFVLKCGYVCEDLKLLPKDFQKDLAKIISVGLVEYDENVQVVWVKNFIKHNPITNPNQIKAACKTLFEIPKTKLIQLFINNNESLFKGLTEGLTEGLDEDLSKPEAEADSYTDSDSYTDTETVVGAETKNSSRPRSEKMTDDEWLAEMKKNPAYAGIDIDRVKGKMEAWCLTNNKSPTRRRLVNWLNREDKPMRSGGRSIQASRGVQGTLDRIEELRQKKVVEGNHV